MRAPLAITTTTVPANSGDFFPIDSTRRTITAPAAAPGPYRNAWAKSRVNGTVKNGDQAVTLTFEILTGNAGTSSDWETDTNGPNGGTITVALNTTQPFNWYPSAADFRVKETAGGTAPNSLVNRLAVVFDAEPGA